jgi:signal transduction histidine kinase
MITPSSGKKGADSGCHAPPPDCSRPQLADIDDGRAENDLTARNGMSLEKKLPLMMSAVLLLILAVGVTLAYRQVRNAAEEFAQQRVKQVTKELANLVSASQPRTAKVLLTAGADPAVLEALGSATPSPGTLAKATDALTRVMIPGDSGVAITLTGQNGRIVAESKSADMSATSTQVEAEDRSSEALNGIVTSPFFVNDGRVFYKVTAPVISHGVQVGAVSQLHRLNANAATERDIIGLTGQDVGILFRNSDGSLWITLGGKPVPAPTNPQTTGGMRTYEYSVRHPGERVLLSEEQLKGLPWVVALELPVSTITAGPRAMLRQFTMVSLLLLLIGAIAMWLIGRRVTHPIARLTRAAEAIAGGDYAQRVDESGDLEISRLAETFNRMAKGTADAHRALEDRFREARSLAEELEHANRQLRSTTDAAEEAQIAAESANAAKSSFLAAMSHELRTPLNAIAGYVQLIQLGLRGPVTPEQLIDLERIRKSHTYLLGLIEDVLNFVKLDAHQTEFHERDVSVDETMRDAETLLAPQMKAAGIAYTYLGCDSELSVSADPDKTRQILVNLLTNAMKFTKPPGSITVSCESSDDVVRLCVTDTGIGIKEDDISRVFEPFVQIGRGLSKPGEGVGLGLTISRDFARRMGGDLVVESTPGEGSSFTLILPRSGADRTAGKLLNQGLSATPHIKIA